jgi:fructoselysine-6-P-deglycase FrlB-like protein
MNPQGFLRDLEGKPDRVRELAASLDESEPWPRPFDAGRIVMIGMGSSRFAAGVAAGRLRAEGVDAVAELASAERGSPPGEQVLAIGISASGGTQETIEALARHRGASATIALTNRPGSPIERAADSVVPMLAGDEEGGVACRSFQHTLALLLALESAATARDDGASARLVRRAAEASEDLLDRRVSWLPAVAELLAGGPATFTIAPVERLSSAEQGALMMREGPRRTADACESGDWLHTDVYLTKPLDYRALLFAGSRFDPDIMGWMRERGGRVVAVGTPVASADLEVRYRHDDDPSVALLAEVLVAELVAAAWWLDRSEGA